MCKSLIIKDKKRNHAEREILVPDEACVGLDPPFFTKIEDFGSGEVGL